MSTKLWIRRDGKRELRHSSTRCMGDSEFSLSLHERPSGRQLYGIDGDGSVGALPGRTGQVFYVLSSKLQVRSTETGALVSQSEGDYDVFAPDPHDTLLLARVSTGGWPPPAGRMRVLEVASGRVLHALPGEFAAFGPDGRRLATLDEEKRVRVHAAESGEELWVSAPLTGRATYVFFSQDGSQVLAYDLWSESRGGTRDFRELLHHFDAATGAPAAVPRPPPPPALRGITQACHDWP